MSAVDVKIRKLNVDLIIVLDDFFFLKNDDFLTGPKGIDVAGVMHDFESGR